MKEYTSCSLQCWRGAGEGVVGLCCSAEVDAVILRAGGGYAACLECVVWAPSLLAVHLGKLFHLSVPQFLHS